MSTRVSDVLRECILRLNGSVQSITLHPDAVMRLRVEAPRCSDNARLTFMGVDIVEGHPQPKPHLT